MRDTSVARWRRSKSNHGCIRSNQTSSTTETEGRGESDAKHATKTSHGNFHYCFHSSFSASTAVVINVVVAAVVTVDEPLPFMASVELLQQPDGPLLQVRQLMQQLPVFAAD